jgi:hypothetical protein
MDAPYHRPCYFCATEVTRPHGIHACEEFDLCGECRSKFICLNYFADQVGTQVLGFECQECGFTCDVPGLVEFDKERKEFVVRVDAKHNFCQSCGAPSKP